MTTEDERRGHVYEELTDLRDRVVRVETLHEGDAERNRAIVRLTEAVQALSLQMNTITTQRNTVIGFASLFGAFLTLVANWIFNAMTRAQH